MPPWYGNEVENQAVTDYLLAAGRQVDARLPADRDAAERFAFDLSCGLCHTVDGFRPIGTFFEDWDGEEIDGFLDEAGAYFDEMPDYYGPPEQRELLVTYLHRITQELTAAAAEEDEETAAVGSAVRNTSADLPPGHAAAVARSTP
jgi:hypothetical protein